MRRVALFAAGFVAAAVLLSRSPSAHAETNQSSSVPVAAEQTKTKKTVTVRRGDSLSKIAQRHKSTYQRIFYANSKIKDPDLIYPGDKLRVPSKHEELKKRPLEEAVASGVSYQQPKTSAAPTYSQKSYRYQPKLTAAVANISGSVWDRLAACESGGNWAINTGNGYYGGLQFTIGSWRGVGGSGYPHQASKSEQIKRAKLLQARQGWGAWPACTAKLGIR